MSPNLGTSDERPPEHVSRGTGSGSVDVAPQTLLRSYVSRIRQKKTEARAINDDVRGIYAEAKADGLNKTALGEVVAFIEKREKDPDALVERSALFDRYLSDHDGTKPATHAHAPEEKPLAPALPRSDEAPPPTPSHSAAVAEAATEFHLSEPPSRPEGCRNPDVCASSIWSSLCYGCGAAAAASTTHSEPSEAEN